MRKPKTKARPAEQAIEPAAPRPITLLDCLSLITREQEHREMMIRVRQKTFGQSPSTSDLREVEILKRTASILHHCDLYWSKIKHVLYPDEARKARK